MMSTPAATRVERVREKRAIVTLRTTSPIFIGIFSLSRSHSCRPRSLLLKRFSPKMVAKTRGKMMYQSLRRTSEALTTYWVNVGSLPFRVAKILTNTGTRNIRRPIRTRVAKTRTIVGYIIAPLTRRFS